MLRNLSVRVALGTAVVVLACGCGRPALTPPLRAVTGLDLEGRPVSPFQATNHVATVLVFMAVDCPISNRSAPELRRLTDRFTPEGAAICIVYPDRDTPVSRIREHARAFNLGNRILRDPEHALVRAAHARVTPEAAVFAATGALVYRGA